MADVDERSRSALTTEAEIIQIKDEIAYVKVVPAFEPSIAGNGPSDSEASTIVESPASNDETTIADIAPVQTSERERHTWFIDTLELHLHRSYYSLRDQYSDASYWGDWDRLFAIIEQAQNIYLETWINCYRLSIRFSPLLLIWPPPSRYPPANATLESLSEAGKHSGWTALHQAALRGASIDVVKKMIALGASSK